ncbi:hypothetical protein [Actinophytocola sp.]|uniref:hypothetical protein n=1 Tax=Actinophytocola sp. TaxID=1872138 RepID=UPI00389B1A18
MSKNLRRSNALPRTDSLVSWIGWHIGEVAGVMLPGLVALTVTPWAAAVSAVVAVIWAVHEVRLGRRQRAIRASRTTRALDASKPEEDKPYPAVGRSDAR